MFRNQYVLPTEPCDHVSELFRRSQTNRSGTCLRIFVVGVNSLLATCSPNAPGSSNNPTTGDYQLSHATMFNCHRLDDEGYYTIFAKGCQGL